MANPRRSSSVAADSGGPQLPVHVQLHRNALSSSSLLHFLKKPHAFPFLLSVFLLLTWISLRLQTSPSSPRFMDRFSREGDLKANLVRFSAEGVSRIVRDKRGWMVNPVTVAVDSGITGGAVSCVSTHVGEIRPGVMRGNHRHHECNETFVIWGARMKFRLENQEMGESENGYAEVVIGGDEVAVAASPSGTAHALLPIAAIVLSLGSFFLHLWWYLKAQARRRLIMFHVSFDTTSWPMVNSFCIMRFFGSKSSFLDSILRPSRCCGE